VFGAGRSAKPVSVVFQEEDEFWALAAKQASPSAIHA
jgi:hypothetical protein